MPDWFKGAKKDPVEVVAADVASLLLIALVLGCVVAAVYIVTQRKQRTEVASLSTTLVLLTVLIAMVTLVIDGDIAKAFSLVGALAIVRFRTVVEDTRDTAFVMFAVIVGMGVGARLVVVPLIGIPIVAAAAFGANLVFGPARVMVREYVLTVRLGLGGDPAKLLGDVLTRYFDHIRLSETVTARQGAALESAYYVQLRPDQDPVTIVAELNRVEGIQSVELRLA